MRLSRLLLVAVLTAIPAYVALLVAYRWAEEPLDPELIRIRATLDAAASLADNGYYAFLGMGALGAQSADAVGHRLVEWDLQNQRATRDGHPTTPMESLGIAWRPWPADAKALICHVPEPGGCVKRVLAARAPVTALLDQMRPLLDEYRGLLEYPVFQVPHLPSVDAFVAINPYRTAKLHQAQIVLLAVDGEKARAVEELENGLALWRRMLAQPGILLIDRKVAIAAVALYAQTASELLRGGQLGVAEARRLAASLVPLTEPERRMRSALELEGAFVAQIANIDFFPAREPPGPRDDFPDRVSQSIVEAFYRRHWVANRAFRQIVAYDEIDRMSAREFRAHLPDAARIVDTKVGPVDLAQYLFNGVGVYVSTAPSSPDYTKHIACAHDIDALLRLVGLQARIVGAEVPDEGVADFIAKAGADFFDPYREAPMRWDRAAGTLWYEATDPKFNEQLLPIRIRERGT